MKKFFSILLVCLMTLTLLTGCGGNSNSVDRYSVSESAIAAKPSAQMATNSKGYSDSVMEEAEVPAEGFSETTQAQDMSLKIIYSTSVDIETIDFDKSIEDLNALVTKYNGFVEQSYQNGTDYSSEYYGYNHYRNASYTIRIPSDSYNTVKGELETIGNVTSISNSAENITEQYTDVESRLKAYRAEEASLLEMLENAETIDEMLSVKSYLRDVQYEIEYMTSRLNNWDKKVAYSTFYIDLNEVENLSLRNSVKETYWQSIGTGFKNSVSAVGIFFKGLFKSVIVSLPFIVTFAVAAFVVIAIIKCVEKKKRNKKSMNKVQPTEEEKTDKQA